MQIPRAWVAAGPVDWILKLTLLVNLAREHAPGMVWLDDPLDFSLQKIPMKSWHMAVKPGRFLDAMRRGIVWGVVTSRFATWHDMAHIMLEDAELSVRCDRYLPELGDEPPWEGADLRSGCLVIDIVDKSSIYVGTSHGGNLFDGLKRTVVEFADDFIDSTVSLAKDIETPGDYFLPGHKYTDPALPYVVFREGETSPIQSSQWINSPAKGIQVVVGGHSMPGINEIIGASIEGLGSLLGTLILVGSLGSAINEILKPLYEDCVAGDTVIDGPDGKERIDVLAQRGSPFRVWSLTESGEKVPATAVFAFKKGNTELLRYTLANGSTIKATRKHRWLTPNGWEEAGLAKVGTLVGVDTAEKFSPIVSIQSLGRQDFYDMHVPGLENYLAEGIWNHNTLLAWQAVRSPQRARNSGWERFYEYFQQANSQGGQAYTISALMVLRAGFWATKTTISWKVAVADGLPYMIGDRGKGHFFLDDRVGLVLKGDTEIHMDRARKLDLAWDDQSPPEWQITVGDDRLLQDPAQRALGKIEALIAGARDLGVW